MQLLWIFAATFLSALLGYHAARHYGLSGITGLVVTLSLNVILLTDSLPLAYQWLMAGDNLLKVSAASVLAVCGLVIAAKLKFMALIKLVVLMLPVSASSIALPHYGYAWFDGESPSIPGFLTFFEKAADTEQGEVGISLPFELPIGLPDQVVSESRVTMARLSSSSRFYSMQEGRAVRTSARVEAETWVVVLGDVVDREGQTWVHIMSPGPTGGSDFRAGVTGYVQPYKLDGRRQISTQE